VFSQLVREEYLSLDELNALGEKKLGYITKIVGVDE